MIERLLLLETAKEKIVSAILMRNSFFLLSFASFAIKRMSNDLGSCTKSGIKNVSSQSERERELFNFNKDWLSHHHRHRWGNDYYLHDGVSSLRKEEHTLHGRDKGQGWGLAKAGSCCLYYTSILDHPITILTFDLWCKYICCRCITWHTLRPTEDSWV